nr:MAG TPA: hypothetical protein [Caudoviricetes sp.]
MGSPSSGSSGSRQSSSRETPRASASLIIVETRPSFRTSSSWIVRRGTPDNSASAGTESFRALRISLRRMIIPPDFWNYVGKDEHRRADREEAGHDGPAGSDCEKHGKQQE